MVKICACCGRAFEAKRSTAKYCSSQCRVRRHRTGSPVIPDEPLRIDWSGSFDDVAEALGLARRAANDLARLSVNGPRQLRPGCRRISDGIAELLRKEEW